MATEACPPSPDGPAPVAIPVVWVMSLTSTMTLRCDCGWRVSVPSFRDAGDAVAAKTWAQLTCPLLQVHQDGASVVAEADVQPCAWTTIVQCVPSPDDAMYEFLQQVAARRACPQRDAHMLTLWRRWFQEHYPHAPLTLLQGDWVALPRLRKLWKQRYQSLRKHKACPPAASLLFAPVVMATTTAVPSPSLLFSKAADHVDDEDDEAGSGGATLVPTGEDLLVPGDDEDEARSQDDGDGDGDGEEEEDDVPGRPRLDEEERRPQHDDSDEAEVEEDDDDDENAVDDEGPDDDLGDDLGEDLDDGPDDATWGGSGDD